MFDGGEGGFLGIEYPRWAAEGFEVVACNLYYTTFGGKIAFENHKAARGLERRIQFADDFLARRFLGGAGFFAEGSASDSEGFAAKESGFNQALRDQCSTACCV